MTTRHVSVVVSDDPGSDVVIEEVPVALVFNGISHVVMMASPKDLEELALGFALSEGIVGAASEFFSAEVVNTESGREVQCHIHGSAFERLQGQRRQLVGRTGCGLCGIESLRQAIRPLQPVTGQRVSGSAVARAVADIGIQQPLAALTGAAHVAAWCGLDGSVQLAREDVGRHVALDKLIGAKRGEFADGFVFVSSRASYEMVHKTAAVGIGGLVAASAPTSLAIEWAERTGLTLIGFARGERYVRYTA